MSKAQDSQQRRDLSEAQDAEEQGGWALSRGTLARMARQVLRYWPTALGGASLMIVGTGAMLAEPWVLGYFVDHALVPRDALLLRNLAILYLGLVCVRVSAVIAQAYCFELLGQKVMQELRLALVAQFQALPVATFDRNPAGRLVTRLTNDIASLAEMFSAGIGLVASNFLVVAGTLGWLFWLNARLALIAVSVLPPLIWLSARFSQRLKIAYRQARSRLSALNAFLAENILGMRVVQLFSRQETHFRRFARINDWYAESQIESIRVFAYFQPTITIASGISIGLVIIYGGAAVARGEAPIGLLVAFFTYVLAMFQPMREMADKWNVFLSGMTSAERIFSILDWPTELAPAEVSAPAPRLEGLRGHVVFENVWFAYEGENWVLRDLSFEVRPGERLGLVGHTGAGKTTIISLLLRFREPTRGRILLDGRDLREYDRRALRAAIGIVQQDVFLFSGSLEENVGLWREDAADRLREAEAALGRLGAGRSSGAEQELDERGGNLSMGERQMVAFARAHSARPAIWVLDEATANVDSASEQRVEAALEQAARGRTCILIAHRLATVRRADLILVLHQGALLEKGNHDELVARDGLYRRLYTYQAAMEAGRASAGAASPEARAAASAVPAASAGQGPAGS